MEITEKVAYLKGLMEGMKIDTETNEGKILSAMVDILEDIGLELEDLWNAQGELEDGLDVVSDDLEDIEDIVYDEDDEESFDDEYYEDDAEEDEDCYATTAPPARRPSTSMSPCWRMARSSAPTAARSWSST